MFVKYSHPQTTKLSLQNQPYEFRLVLVFNVNICFKEVKLTFLSHP